MQRAIRHASAFAATVVLVFGTSALAQEANPHIGTWKIDTGKSKFATGTAMVNSTTKIEPTGKGIHATVHTEYADGTKTDRQFTANYDGKRKHRTKIGSRVHTAVHTTIVAPVEIGDGATIAGGSRIWRDVPADSLAMNPTQQRHVEGWVPPYEREAPPASPGE